MVGLVDLNDETNQGRPRLRVLLIVDSLYWTVGHFACQVAKDNPWIEAVICSQYVIRQFLKRYGQFPLSFDLAHFLNTKTMEPFCGRLPIVVTLHHMDSSTKVTYLEDCDAVMTVSGQWYQHLTDLGIPRERLGLVPFAVDSDQFYPASREERRQIRHMLNISEDAYVIGFSGRRTSDNDGRKGMDCLVEGLRKMRQAYPNLVVLIIGPGWQHLVHRLHKDGIDSVHVPYQLDHTEIAKLYRVLDVFWVTSRIEGGPVPLLEAMASGIACVSTPVGAALDLVKDQKNGFIVQLDRSDDFVKISLELIKDQDLMQRIGEAARSTIVRERSWSRTKSCLAELYEMAIKNFQASQTKGLSSRMRVNAVPPDFKQSGFNARGSFDDFGPKTRRWIKACEYLRGSKMLIQLGEWRRAMQLVGLAIKEDPRDIHLWPQIMSVFVSEGKKKLLPRRVGRRGP